MPPPPPIKGTPLERRGSIVSTSDLDNRVESARRASLALGPLLSNQIMDRDSEQTRRHTQVPYIVAKHEAPVRRQRPKHGKDAERFPGGTTRRWLDPKLPLRAFLDHTSDHHCGWRITSAACNRSQGHAAVRA